MDGEKKVKMPIVYNMWGDTSSRDT